MINCGPTSTRRTMISWGLTGRTEAVLPLKSVLRSPVTSQQPHISLQRSLATQRGCKTPWYPPSSLPDCHSVQVRISPKVSSCYFNFCKTTFSFNPARTTAQKNTQLLIQTWESFVSKIGGSLGLLVGGSFMMFWDLGEFTVNVFLIKV